MRRRTLLLSLLAAGGLSACDEGVEPVATGSSGSAPPIFGSTTASSLAPQSVTHYRPVPGTAPAGAAGVGRRHLNLARGVDRPLPTRVWYPAAGVGSGGAAVDDAAPAPGSYPVILFSHGLTSSPDDFAALLTRWAQAGFVVAGPAYPHTRYGATAYDPGDVVNQPADAKAVLDALFDLGGDPLGAVLDRDRVAAAGHSGGGITTAGLFSRFRDERLKAGMMISGTDFQGMPFAGAPAAMLVVHGTDDGTVKYAAGRTVFEAVPWSRVMLTVQGGGHVIDEWWFETIARTSTDFWRWALYGDAAAAARLPAGAAANGVATLDQQL